MARARANRGAGGAREKLLRAAGRLFYERGVNAVGIDEVIRAAGVAKMSLYHHFGSKDELVVQVLRDRHERWMEDFLAGVRAVGAGPGNEEGAKGVGPLAVFDALERWFEGKGFRGCMFLNTAAEIHDPKHPARRVCREHKEALRGVVGAMLREAGVGGAEQMASSFMLLIEGAICRALVTGSAAPAREARGVAEVLLREAGGRPGPGG